MERIVIVGYKPLAGMENKLKELMKIHWQILNAENLVSDRRSIMMEAQDGTIVEVFGWKSKEAMEAAHNNPKVQRMWAQYAETCEYVPIGSLKESSDLFPEFAPL